MEERTDKTRDGSPSTVNYHSAPTSPTGPKDIPTSSSSLSIYTRSCQAEPARETDQSLESTFKTLHLKEPPQPKMFAAVGAIFEHASQDEDEIDLEGFGNWRAVLQRADQLGGRGLTDPEALNLIKQILDHLWSSDLEEDLVNAAKILADLCRERE